MTKILVIDNYDSFVYTLVGYLEQLGASTTVYRNDIDCDPAVLIADYDGVLISPGPGNPSQAGITIPVIRAAAAVKKPLLGVCLGHQALAESYGATVSHAPELMHGKTSQVLHNDQTLFKGVPSEFTAARYHSLAVEPETLPEELITTAQTANGIVMALQHRSLPLFGVQYHPESVLTEHGYLQLANWLEITGCAGSAKKAKELKPLRS